MGVVQKNGFWVTVISYVGIALGFVSSMILFPRLLAPEEVGLTRIMLSAATMLAQLCALGGGNIVLRFFPFFKTENPKHNGIFAITFLISIIGIILFSILFLIFKPFIINYYNADSSLFIKYFLLTIPFSAFIVFYTLFSSWLRSMMKVIASAVYLEIILRVATIFSVLCYATGKISLNVFVCLYVGSFSVPAIGLFLHCWKCGFLTFKIKITNQMRTYFKPAILYGLFCLFAGIGSSIVGNIDSMMLGSSIGLECVAVYGIALNFISMLQMPYRALSSISSPLVAEYWKENDMKSMETLYKKFSLNIVIVALFFFLLIWVNIDTVYRIMPAIYATGKWALLILFSGKLVDMATGLNATILNTSKKYRWDLYFAALLIISAIVTNILLIPRFGIEGAALATSISIVFLNVSKVLAVKKFFGIHPFSYRILLVLLFAVATWALIVLIPVLPHWLPDLLMRCLLVVVFFALPMYLFEISSDFNNLVNSVVKGLFKRIKRNN